MNPIHWCGEEDSEFRNPHKNCEGPRIASLPTNDKGKEDTNREYMRKGVRVTRPKNDWRAIEREVRKCQQTPVKVSSL